MLSEYPESTENSIQSNDDWKSPDLIFSEDLIENALNEEHPILIVENVQQVEFFRSGGIPAICTSNGSWSALHAEQLLEVGISNICFYSDDVQWVHSAAIILDGYTKVPGCLKPKDFRGMDLDQIYDEAFRAPLYDPRDVYGASSTIQLEMLMLKEFEPVKWIIKDVLPEGLSIIAGPSKLGKSWLTLSIALAVKFGGNVLNEIPVISGDVLLWALEDSQRRLQSRIKQLEPNHSDWSAGHKLTIATSENLPPQLDKGGFELLEEWIEDAENPRLIVIDVWEKVAPDKKPGDKEYTSVYGALRNLHRLAASKSVSILIVHHTVKGRRDGDPFDKINGSRAFTACPDTALILDHDTNGFADANLYGRGRDLIEFEYALDFDAGRWSILGDKDSVSRSGQRQAILDALKAGSETGMTPSDISLATGAKPDATRKMLGRMVKSGEIRKQGRGLYVLPSI